MQNIVNGHAVYVCAHNMHLLLYLHTWAIPFVDLQEIRRRESVSLSKPIEADGGVFR